MAEMQSEGFAQASYMVTELAKMEGRLLQEMSTMRRAILTAVADVELILHEHGDSCKAAPSLPPASFSGGLGKGGSSFLPISPRETDRRDRDQGSFDTRDLGSLPSPGHGVTSGKFLAFRPQEDEESKVVRGESRMLPSSSNMGLKPSRNSSLYTRLQTLEHLVLQTGSMKGQKSRGNWVGWPMDLEARSELSEIGPHGDRMETLNRLADLHRCAASSSIVGLAASSVPDDKDFSFILRPDSRFRLGFDFLSLLVLAFQLWYTPFALTWPSTVTGGLEGIVLWSTALFWMLDFVLNFFTGFYTIDGEVDLKTRHVVQHYLRTWFFIDLLCVIADMVNLLPDLLGDELNNGAASRVLRVVKLHRFLRVLLLLRMLRVTRTINAVMESRVSAAWTFMIRTFQISALLVWFTHIAACSWWAIGRWAPPGRTGSRWIDMHEVGPEDHRTPILDIGWVYQYATSYHWALAQITLGAHEISPVNSTERVLAIICNLFGLIFGSSLISILSMTTMQYREADMERSTKVRTLHEFLVQHSVRISTRLRVTRQVHERVRPRDRMLTESDVTAIQVLSQTLSQELRCQLFTKHVRNHALFKVWEQLHAESINNLCKEGLKFVALPPEDELFTVGNVSTAAFVILDGVLRYTQDPADGLVRELSGVTCGADDWLSEPTWWCHWVHVGTASTVNATSLVAVPPEAVLAAMLREASVHCVTTSYGLRFHMRITQNQDVLATDLEQHHHASFKGIACTLPRDVHVLMGVAALQQCSQRKEGRQLIQKLQRQDLIRPLEEEVLEGRSLLMLDDEGQVQRKVALLVLEITNNKGELLVELAHSSLEEGDEWSPCLRLPAEKQLHDEVPQETLERLLDSRLAELKDPLMDLAPKMRFEEEQQDSEHFGIGTQYLKTFFSFTSDEAVDKRIEEGVAVLNRNGTHGNLPSSRFSMNATSQVAGTASLFSNRRMLVERFATLEKAHLLQGSGRRGIYAWMAKPEFEMLLRQPELDGVHSMIGKIANAVEIAWNRAEEALYSSSGTSTDRLDSVNGDPIDRI